MGKRSSEPWRSIRRMFGGRLAVVTIAFGSLTTVLLSQSVNSQAPGASFEVVSIKQSPSSGVISNRWLPDGGFSMTRLPIAILLQRAYPSIRTYMV